MNSPFILAGASMAGLALRLLFSLGIVLGLIAVLVWVARSRAGSLRFGMGPSGSPIRIHGRVQLSRTSTITLLEVGGQALLVAGWEQGVEVLAQGTDLLPPHEDVEPSSSDDRTSSPIDPSGSTPPRMNLIEALREWSVRRN